MKKNPSPEEILAWLNEHLISSKFELTEGELGIEIVYASTSGTHIKRCVGVDLIDAAKTAIDRD